ncbi:MAG: flagellar basal-body MS-ring/collar protein FliF [Gammaproteobacteria bacterium]|nr:flagellar basal-body MS-ring/collar protein FliF [Gammaproteobacteria bacterium]
MAENAATGFSGLPVTRQVGLLVGLAASIALGVWVALWATEPNYTALYSGLDTRDAGEVVSALQASTIPYKLDQATGAVMVEAGRVHEARLKLAEQGLPKGTGMGIEMLQEEQSFGTSQFVESARYHHAMETELARTISTMRNVKSVRVHLAIPKRSVFVRERTEPSASVALSLYGGRNIEQGQVNSIIHLVASSVPHLSAEQVTVVDQNGRLLSSGDSGTNVAMTAKQYEYNRKLEQDYANRIEHLLEPIIGQGKVRATVNAEIDFTEEERTEELFNPERQSVRSEQSSETANYASAMEGGIPGVQSNQPPASGRLVQGAGALNEAVEVQGQPLKSSKNAVRNYELDRTILHKRQGAGEVKRMTVAVLVDDRITVKAGKTERTPLTNEEIQRITTLVQQSIGYDQQRGDRVNVINASFTPTEEIEALPELSLLDQPWVRNIGKQLLAGLIILVLIFTVLKPTVKNLAAYTPPPALLPASAEGQEAGAGGQGQMARLEQQGGSPIALPSGHDNRLDFAKSMVGEDPRRVANVVKGWIGNES